MLAVVFLVWTGLTDGHGRLVGHHRASPRSPCSAALVAANRAGREGWAFIGTFVTIAIAVATLFLALFPDVMPTRRTDAATP